MLLRYVGAFCPFVMSLPELPRRLALCCWWITGCPVSSSSFDKVICALVFYMAGSPGQAWAMGKANSAVLVR